MATFNKAVVVSALKAALEDATKATDAEHAQAIRDVEARNKSALEAKAWLDDIISGPDLRVMAKALSEWNNRKKLDNAARDTEEVPERTEHARERRLKQVIEIVESSPNETVTVSDLRGLGVLEFVKFSECSK
jgi:hypothetical protein